MTGWLWRGARISSTRSFFICQEPPNPEDEAENTDSDAPTVRNVRVHSPTMEDRGTGFSAIKRSKLEIKGLKTNLAIELDQLQKSLERFENIVINDLENKRLPASARSENMKLASPVEERQQQMQIDQRKLEIDYHTLRTKLLNAIRPTETSLKEYHDEVAIIKDNLYFDLRILFAKTEYDKRCIQRNDKFEELRKKIESLALDGSRSSFDSMMKACTMLEFGPIDINSEGLDNIFDAPQYRVLYEFAERLANEKIVVSGSYRLYLITSAVANLMKEMLRQRFNYTFDTIPAPQNAFATLAEFCILRSDENALTTKKLLEQLGLVMQA
ncbi:hypothetical protein Plhal703r1_c02g0013391 [Plasmopara halstedii]